MSKQRVLTFASLADVMPEVEFLLAGHTTVGDWSLAQVCNHLSSSIRLTLQAPPVTLPSTPGQDAVRCRFFQLDRFPQGRKAPLPALIPLTQLDVHTEAESLRQAIARFLLAPGPFPAHPLLGPLTGAEWTRFHCMHCAHHLGFAVPS